MYQDSMLKRQRSRNWNPVRCHYLTVELSHAAWFEIFDLVARAEVTECIIWLN